MTSAESKAYHRAYYLAHKEKAIAKAKTWRLENPVRFKELQDKLRPRYAVNAKIARDEWRKKNPDKLKKYRKTQAMRGNTARGTALWRIRHPEKYRASSKSWWIKNPHKPSAYAAARKAAELCATPPWADSGKIESVYKDAIRISAETGVKHHVDHIWPLRGVGYRGLHVHWNLRIIPGSENRKKYNKRPQ